MFCFGEVVFCWFLSLYFDRSFVVGVDFDVLGGFGCCFV